jgi:hypothetical protein
VQRLFGDREPDRAGVVLEQPAGHRHSRADDALDRRRQAKARELLGVADRVVRDEAHADVALADGLDEPPRAGQELVVEVDRAVGCSPDRASAFVVERIDALLPSAG